MQKNIGTPANSVRSYKCARCGNMFEAQDKFASTCPICGYTCRENRCHRVDASDEDY